MHYTLNNFLFVCGEKALPPVADCANDATRSRPATNAVWIIPNASIDCSLLTRGPLLLCLLPLSSLLVHTVAFLLAQMKCTSKCCAAFFVLFLTPSQKMHVYFCYCLKPNENVNIPNCTNAIQPTVDHGQKLAFLVPRFRFVLKT